MDLQRRFLATVDYAHRHGLTSIHDAGEWNWSAVTVRLAHLGRLLQVSAQHLWNSSKGMPFVRQKQASVLIVYQASQRGSSAGLSPFASPDTSLSNWS
jgi:hypothetical protein